MPRVTDAPRVEELPWGDETSGVTLEGYRMTGADRLGQGGDGNYPAIRYTKGRSNTIFREEMESNQETVPPPST